MKGKIKIKYHFYIHSLNYPSGFVKVKERIKNNSLFDKWKNYSNNQSKFGWNLIITIENQFNI